MSDFKGVVFAQEDCYNFKYPSTYIMGACTVVDGIKYVGMRHNICLHAIVKDGKNAIGADQGFIDNHGNFLNREEAAILAEQTGQRKRITGSKDTLFSEDLW